MSDERIRDIPSLQKLVDDIRDFEQFKSRFEDIKPLLEQFGINTDDSEYAFDGFEGLKQKAEEIVELPDKFNDHFVERGWVCHERFDVDTVKAAVKKAEKGDIEAAEEELADYYNNETIRHQLTWLKAVDTFVDKKNPFDHDGAECEYRETQSRYDLALKALEDYNAKRYHACIPVVFAILDGLAQQVYVNIHGESRSFTAKEARHEAWDSIAGHSTGLEQLKDVILKKGRQKTRTTEIKVPYRNGIMHGMDLNYDNKLVAAKTWNLLFAIGEWARKADQDEPTPSSDESDLTIQNILDLHKENQKTKERIDQWVPREIIIGENIPADGEPDEYDVGTPERALVDLLSKWTVENYGHMAEFFRGTDGKAEEPGFVADQFKQRKLKSFELVDIADTAPAATDITVKLVINLFGDKVTEEKKVRLIHQGDDGSLRSWGEEDGEWILPMFHSLM